jgi:pimeloyl-ACP methyl ester carboxylesterase
MADLKFVQRIALRYYKTKFRIWTAISKKKAAQKAFDLFCTPQKRNLRKPPKIFEQAEKLQFKVEGIKVNGWRWSPHTDAGSLTPARRVLIIHGFESSVTNFDRYIRPLIKKGYEVLAFDAPAHGRSGGKKITAPLYKKTIQEIHRLFGPVQSYMAHSFGGLAVSLALEETEHTSNDRLVLIAPATETSTAIDTFFNFLDLDPVLRPEFDKIILQKGGVSPSWYSIGRAMKHIRARVLWFHDEDDDVTPLSDVLKVKAENYPHLEFVFTKGLGHRRIYRDNKVTRSIVEFL